MTTTPDPPARAARTARRRQYVGLGAAAAIVVAVAGTYAAAGEWSTAAGALVGGALVLLLMALSSRRAARRGAEAATAERVFGGRADERDARVYLGALAVVGLVAFLVAALAPVAVSLGLDPETTLRIVPYVLIVTGVVSFVVIDRRT